jgi:hypothetical protein
VAPQWWQEGCCFTTIAQSLSCDIAFSLSPAAASASPRSLKHSSRITLSPRNDHTWKSELGGRAAFLSDSALT